MAGTLSRTITGGCSATGYKSSGSINGFNNGISAGGAISGGSVTSLYFKVTRIKSWADLYYRVLVNGNDIGCTEYFSANSSEHTDECWFQLENSYDFLLSDGISSISLQPMKRDSSYSGNLIYIEPGRNSIELTVYTSYSDPTPPDTVRLNGTNGNIYIKPGTGVTLSWSGGWNDSLNPFNGYDVYKNGSFFRSTNDTSMSVDAPSAGNSLSYYVVRKGTRSNSGGSVSRTVYCYTDATAPNSVLINGQDSVTIDAGETATLTWSGASSGAGNAISSYNVLRSTSPDSGYSVYRNVSGSPLAVPSSSTMGQTYYYKVQAVAARNSPISGPYAAIVTRVYTNINPPATVVCTPSVASVSSQATLSWSAGTGGTNTNVVSYEVYRATDPNGEYTLLEAVQGTSLIVTSPPAIASGYYYKIKAIADKAGFDSDLSSVYAILAVPDQPYPPIIQGLQGKTYNPRPRILAIVPTEKVPGAKQSIIASGWTSSRLLVAGGEKVVLRRDNEYSASGERSLAVVCKDELNSENSVVVNLYYESSIWTDDPVEAGSTAIKAAHMNELRQAIDNLRLYYGMEAYSWSEPIVAGVTSAVNWASHAIEVKNQILAIQNFVNQWDNTNIALDISLPEISTFYAPKASVINQLREAITLL